MKYQVQEFETEVGFTFLFLLGDCILIKSDSSQILVAVVACFPQSVREFY